jgi:hypothetical protein
MGFGASFVEAYQGGGQLYNNLPFFFSQVFPTDQNAPPPQAERRNSCMVPPTSISQAPPPATFVGLSLNATHTIMERWREEIAGPLIDVSYVPARSGSFRR